MAPRDLRQFFPASQFGDIRNSVPVTMGQSGAVVYAVTTETGAYILRIHDPGQNSWEKTILTQEIVSQYEIAPALVHIDRVERAAVSAEVSFISFGAAVSQPTTRAAASQV